MMAAAINVPLGRAFVKKKEEACSAVFLTWGDM